MNSHASRSSLWVTVLLAGVSTGYLFLFFLPEWKNIAALRDDARAKRDYVVQAASSQAALLATQRELDLTKAFNQTSATALPKVSALPTFFADVSRLAKEAGTTTVRFDPEPSVKHAHLSHFTLSVTIAGSSARIHDFLRRLEGMPTQVWIESLRVGGSKKASEHTTADITMVVFTDNSVDSDGVDPADQPINPRSQASAAAPGVGALP